MIIYQKFISRADLRANPEVTYLFGDNLLRKGFGGQAAEMRNEPNAIGIPTKRGPWTSEHAYFTDEEFNDVKDVVDEEFAKIKTEIVIVPLDGLGTGLAQLDRRAPRIYNYIREKLNDR